MSTTTAPGFPKNRNAHRLPTPHTDHYGWQLHAACRDQGSEVFFHPEHERGRAREHRDEAAKRLCASCPVQSACLDHALRSQEPYGVWGGLTETERARIPHADTRAA